MPGRPRPGGKPRQMTGRAIRVVAAGLRFPEGPVALADGSVLLVEIEAARLTRVAADGTKTTVSQHTGGPNGAAIGPDGKVYICNNGGFTWRELPNIGLIPTGQAEDYSGGRIERVDLAIGRDRDALHPLRRPPAEGAQRSRVRCARRLLLHRPRQEPPARYGPRRRLLRQGRRQPDQAGRLPLHHAQRLRPVARRTHALLRRDGVGEGCGRWTLWSRAR